MATTLKEKLKTLPPKRQEKIALRTNELIAKEKLNKRHRGTQILHEGTNQSSRYSPEEILRF